MQHFRRLVILGAVGLGGGLGLAHWGGLFSSPFTAHANQAGPNEGGSVSNPTTSENFIVRWRGPQGKLEDLKTWSWNELQKMSHSVQWEKEPNSQQMVKWKGALISQVLDKALKELPLESQAQVDLIILKNLRGEQALIPRALAVKYPLMLGFKAVETVRQVAADREGTSLLHSVIPWSSKPRILTEGLPLGHYFLKGVSSLELANYRERFGSLFLKRRTDPLAVRGEKIFVQTCTECHSVQQGGSPFEFLSLEKIKKFTSSGHPEIDVSLKFSDRDRRSIGRYLDAHRVENPVSFSKYIQADKADQAAKIVQ